jgi:crossover junction endodeoxyribonuclease RusA
MWRKPRTGAFAGRMLLSHEGCQYRKAVAQSVMLQGGPSVRQERIAVDIEVRMPDKRRRDLDNLPNTVLDALTRAAVWADDSQFDDLRVWFSDQPRGERERDADGEPAK